MTRDYILNILKEINSLPASEVKSKINSLSLKFEDWLTLTNSSAKYFHYENLNKRGYKQKFEGKVDISYEEFQDMINLPITREIPRRKSTPDEISKEIEQNWKEVREKYNPIREIIRLSLDTRKVLQYGVTIQNIEECIDKVEENIKEFENTRKYFEELYGKSKESEEFCKEIYNAMNDGLEKLLKVQYGKELSSDDLILALGLNKEEISKYFTERMQLASENTSATHSIMAEDGKAFKLNENGELEIIDETIAKDLILRGFFRDGVSKEIKVLGNSGDLHQIADMIKYSHNYDEYTNEEREAENSDYYGENGTKFTDSNEYYGVNEEDMHKGEKETEQESEKNDGDLSSLSIGKLKAVVEKNKETIEKQGLIVDILKQQEKIAKQNAEIEELKHKAKDEKGEEK